MDSNLALERFGLTPAEIKIYLTLLKFGQLQASEIAKKTDMNRTFTYDRLARLTSIGLVSSSIQDTRKYFHAADPSQLLAVLKEREEEIKEVLPTLEKMRLPTVSAPHVEVYSSKKGVKTALNLALKEAKSIRVHGDFSRFKVLMPVDFEIWNARRIKANIYCKIVGSDNLHLTLSSMQYISDEKDRITSTILFGDVTLTIMWSEQPLAILIRNKEITDNNIGFFEALWNQPVRIYTGPEGIRQAYWEMLDGAKHFRGYGYSKQLADIYTVDFSNAWHKVRIEKGIDNKIISYDEKSSKNYFAPRVKKTKLFDVRYLPKELLGPVNVTFTETMVVTFIYTGKGSRVVINRDKETISVYKKHFEKLWKISKK